MSWCALCLEVLDGHRGNNAARFGATALSQAGVELPVKYYAALTCKNGSGFRDQRPRLPQKSEKGGVGSAASLEM